jgi:hypothetical protein
MSDSDITVVKTIGKCQIKVTKSDYVRPWWLEPLHSNDKSQLPTALLLFIPVFIYTLFFCGITNRDLTGFKGCGVIVTLSYWDEFDIPISVARGYRFTSDTKKDTDNIRKIIDNFTVQAEKRIKQEAANAAEEAALKAKADARKEQCDRKYQAIVKEIDVRCPLPEKGDVQTTSSEGNMKRE